MIIIRKIIKALFAILIILFSAAYAFIFFGLMTLSYGVLGKIFFITLALICTAGFFAGIYTLFAKRVSLVVKLFAIFVLAFTIGVFYLASTGSKHERIPEMINGKWRVMNSN